MELIPGETATIRVANPIWYRRHAYANNVTINQYNVYTGTIVKEKWHKDTKIGITTGNPKTLLKESRDPKVRKFLTRGEET